MVLTYFLCDKSLRFLGFNSSSVKRQRWTNDLNVFFRSKTSDSENLKETNLWLRLGATWWLQRDKGAGGWVALPECPAQRMSMWWRVRAQAQSDTWAGSGVLSPPYDTPSFLFSSYSSLLTLMSSPLGFEACQEVEQGFPKWLGRSMAKSAS